MILPTDLLAQRQQKLVNQILHPYSSDKVTNHAIQQGLNIYRNNLISTATRAIQIAYPVLTQLLGEGVMRQLASRLIQNHPPRTGDWGDWGQPLAALIAQTELINDYPFLSDIAALEWEMHHASRSLSKSIDIQHLSQIDKDELLNSIIELNACVRIVESSHPVDHIWNAHQSRSERPALNEKQFLQAIRNHQGQCQLLIYQHNQLAQFTRLSDAELKWFQDILDERTVAELLDQNPNFDFINWLTHAIENQWISNLRTQPKSDF